MNTVKRNRHCHVPQWLVAVYPYLWALMHYHSKLLLEHLPRLGIVLQPLHHKALQPNYLLNWRSEFRYRRKIIISHRTGKKNHLHACIKDMKLMLIVIVIMFISGRGRIIILWVKIDAYFICRYWLWGTFFISTIRVWFPIYSDYTACPWEAKIPIFVTPCRKVRIIPWRICNVTDK